METEWRQNGDRMGKNVNDSDEGLLEKHF